MKLNKNLMKQQKVSKKEEKNLKKLYKEVYDLLYYAKEVFLAKKTNKKNVNRIVNNLKDLENKLQENWNFDIDPLKHTWWDKLPGCSCPKMDNSERFGFSKIISSDCPWHKSLMNL